MIEKYSLYQYQIMNNPDGEGFVYEIYTDDPDHKYWERTNVLRESGEWFDTEQEARFAAIGHINLLENGEG